MSIAARAQSQPVPRSAAARQRERRRLLMGLLFSSPFWIGFIALTAFPMLASLYLSFTSFDAVNPPVFIGIDNYVAMLDDIGYKQALLNTVVYSVASVPLTVALSVLVAVLLNQKVKLVAGWRSIYYLPSITPVVAYGVLWRWMLSTNYGIINAGLGQVGISPIDWLGDARWILVAFVMTSLWTVGTTMVINLAGLQSIPTELYDAAKVDGAGPLKTFTSITLPMLSPVLFYNVVMGIVGAMQSFSFFIVLTAAAGVWVFSNIGQVYMTYLYQIGWRFFQMGYASAMAWVLFAIILILTLIVVRTSKRWVYYEGEWLTGK
jgi:multiple sugar transport system permease protein